MGWCFGSAKAWIVVACSYICSVARLVSIFANHCVMLKSASKVIEREHLKSGDVVFFKHNGRQRMRHAGILSATISSFTPPERQACPYRFPSNKYWNKSYFSASASIDNHLRAESSRPVRAMVPVSSLNFIQTSLLSTPMAKRVDLCLSFGCYTPVRFFAVIQQ